MHKKNETHFQRGMKKTHKIAEKIRKIEAKVDASEKAKEGGNAWHFP